MLKLSYIALFFLIFSPSLSYSYDYNLGVGKKFSNFLQDRLSPLKAQPPEQGNPGTKNAKLSTQLCELRRMFCGTAGIALVSAMVIFLGLMTLSGKISWGIVLLFGTAATIFITADQVAKMIIGDDPKCACIR